MRQKGPCSLPFIRRTAIILRFRDMASESKRKGRKRGKKSSQKGWKHKSMSKGSTERWILKKLRK